MGLSVGTQMHVAVGAPATYDIAGYEAKDWIKVGDVENVPAFGGTAQVPEFIPLETGVVDKGKGSINYGASSVPLRRAVTDAGQVALQSLFDGANRDEIASVKFTDADGGIIYCTSVVSGFTYNIADANAWTRNEVSFAWKTKPVIDSDVFTVTFIAGANGAIIGKAVQIVPNGGDAEAVYAAPDSGYVFDEWSDTNSDNPRTLTNVVANVTLTAAFIVDE